MKKNIWILMDNRIGSRHQAEGIADNLDKTIFNIINKEIKYTNLAALPNFIRGRSLLGLTQESKNNLKDSFPDMVLSSSRRTAPVARWIKKQNPQTKLIQLLHIGHCGTKEFTKIYVPEHDKHKFSASNMTYTIGSPHFINQEKLAQAFQTWQKKFAHLPRPITALIIGGAIKKHPFSIKNAELLAQKVAALKNNEGGSLLITTSRRTGALAEQKIMSYLKDIPNYAYLWGSKEENPYLGFLACADNIIVTGDSVSMCCEATAAGVPLRIFTGQDWLSPKHLRFIDSLYTHGYAVDINNKDKNISSPSPLNTAKEIADELKTLL